MKRIRFGALVAGLAAVLVMTATPAPASTTFTVTCSPTTAGSNPQCSNFQDFGTAVASSMTTHLPAGWVIAHGDSTTSPITPVPANGDSVGSVDGYGDLFGDGCGNGSVHTTYPVTWVYPIGTGAPTGTVARMKATATLFGFPISVSIFIVKTSGSDTQQSGVHYDISVPNMPAAQYCTGSPSSMTTTIYGTVPSSSPAKKIHQLPSTTGTYTVKNVWTSTASVTSNDSATITVT